MFTNCYRGINTKESKRPSLSLSGRSWLHFVFMYRYVRMPNSEGLYSKRDVSQTPSHRVHMRSRVSSAYLDFKAHKQGIKVEISALTTLKLESVKCLHRRLCFSVRVDRVWNASSSLSLSPPQMPLQKLLFSATLTQNPEKLQQLGLHQPRLFSSAHSNDPPADATALKPERFDFPQGLTVRPDL